MARPSASDILSIPTFSTLRKDEIERIRQLSRAIEVQRGDVIFREGEAAEQMYFALTGRVKIIKAVGDREMILEILGSGEPIGAVAVYEERPLPATAVALEDSTLLEIPALQFLRLLEADPVIVRRLLSGLTLRLMNVNQRITHMAGNVEQRVARLLLILAERMGSSDESGLKIPLKLTRQEIADLTGTTVETAIRLMSRWSREGVVESSDDGFIVRNPEVLRNSGGILE